MHRMSPSAEIAICKKTIVPMLTSHDMASLLIAQSKVESVNTTKRAKTQMRACSMGVGMG